MRLSAGVFLCLWSVASAQDTVSAELVSDPFVESYEPEVSVSGNVVVGIMTTAAAAAIAKDQIAVNATAATGGQRLCLKAASRDGIYTSRNVYSLPGEAGNVHLPYRSELGDVVDSYGEHEIALSATDVFVEVNDEIKPCEYISEGRRTILRALETRHCTPIVGGDTYRTRTERRQNP